MVLVLFNVSLAEQSMRTMRPYCNSVFISTRTLSELNSLEVLEKPTKRGFNCINAQAEHDNSAQIVFSKNMHNCRINHFKLNTTTIVKSYQIRRTNFNQNAGINLLLHILIGRKEASVKNTYFDRIVYMRLSQRDKIHIRSFKLEYKVQFKSSSTFQIARFLVAPSV